MTFRPAHLVAALLLHVVLLTLLAGGVQCSAKPQRPPVIEAVLLDPSRQDVARQKLREQQRRVEEQRKAEAERQRLEQEAQRQKQSAEQNKKQEAERQRAAVAEAARKKKEDDARRAKQAAEQKKAEEAARLKKEQDAQRAKEAEARREAAQKAELAESMRAEETQRQIAREEQARAASEREASLAQWVGVLSRHIARNWVRPPGAPEEFECRVRIQLLPDGTVTSAGIVQSCGNALLDKSVEDAVFRSSPLPRPSDPAVFDRDLDIRFIPQ